MKGDPTLLVSLEAMRHSCAHLMAAAVQALWPDVKFGIGPVIENGLYYDFDMAYKLTPEDLPNIEEKMRELAKDALIFEQFDKPIEEALGWAQKEKQPYKKELIERIGHTDDTKVASVSFYRLGQFVDLCRGPHVHSTKDIGPYTLLNVAGAYWRGNEKNPMLQRIYGTCFPTQKELDEYLWQQEEAKKRDHKKLGRELDLFVFSPLVGPGLPMLTPKGYAVRKTIEDYLTALKKKHGLQFVWTPHIARSELYKKSKHWQKYDAMMPPVKIEDEEYALKPMNCPHHFQIYLSKPRSYKELPLRLAENATVYRFEKSGELNGLLRVRAVNQDDSHWFVPHDLLNQEIDKALEITETIYRDFGITNYSAHISVRDNANPQKYLGKPESWDIAEKELVGSVEKRNISHQIVEGEAAFYGPKIDVMVEDCLKREWQLTTIQLDFNQPDNFDLTYVDSDGSDKKVAVLHIAFLGSLERFIAILIEHYAGALPAWLAPVQAVIIPIADRHGIKATEVSSRLTKQGIRVEVDHRSETMQAKIRNAQLQKIPYMLIIGDRELESDAVSVRLRTGETLDAQPVDRFIEEFKKLSYAHID